MVIVNTEILLNYLDMSNSIEFYQKIRRRCMYFLFDNYFASNVIFFACYDDLSLLLSKAVRPAGFFGDVFISSINASEPDLFSADDDSGVDTSSF